MSKKNLLAILLTLVCALCLSCLVACGGGGGNSGGGGEAAPEEEAAAPEEAAEPAAAEPAKTDEELIIEDLGITTSEIITAEEMIEGFRADETMAAFEEQGFDLELYATNLAKIYKVEVVSVTVDGDKAVASLAITAPALNEEAEAYITGLIDAESLSSESMTEDEIMVLTMNKFAEALGNDDFPVAVSNLDIDYEKVDGTWSMVDPEGVVATITAIAAGEPLEEAPAE